MKNFATHNSEGCGDRFETYDTLDGIKIEDSEDITIRWNDRSTEFTTARVETKETLVLPARPDFKMRSDSRAFVELIHRGTRLRIYLQDIPLDSTITITRSDPS